MPYWSWPTGVVHIPDTHITNEVTSVDHWAIMNGMARDVANIQYNINTTNLFVSGWMWPVPTGYFDTITVDRLFVEELNSDYMDIGKLDNEHIDHIYFSDTSPTDFNMYDSAINDMNVPIESGFRAETNVSLGFGSGFIANGPSISGGIYDYYVDAYKPKSNFDYLHADGVFSPSGENNFVEKRIFLSNPNGISFSGQVNDTDIHWLTVGGHDHKENKIPGIYIQDHSSVFSDKEGTLIHQSPMSYLSRDADIVVSSGYFKAYKQFKIKKPKDEELDFTLLPGTEHSSHKEEDLGVYPMISYKGEVYAAPSGGYTLYSSKDFINWESHAIDPSGKTMKIVDFEEYGDKLWLLMHERLKGDEDLYGGNIRLQMFKDLGNKDTSYRLHRAKPNSLCIANDQLFVCGKKWHNFPNANLSWDSHFMVVSGYMNEVAVGTGYGHWIDNSISVNSAFYSAGGGVSGLLCYSLPFLKYIDTSDFGSYNLINYYDESFKSTDWTDYAGDFNNQIENTFNLRGNGFNEVTSVIEHNGNLGGYRYRFKERKNNTGGNARQYWQYKERYKNIIENPIIALGNANLVGKVSSSGWIFAGNEPIVMDIPKMWDPLTPSGMPYIHPANGSISILNSGIFVNSMIPDIVSGVLNSTWRPDEYFDFKTTMINTAKGSGSWVTNEGLTNESYMLNRNPDSPGFLCAPWCKDDALFYRHEGQDLINPNDDPEYNLNYDINDNGNENCLFYDVGESDRTIEQLGMPKFFERRCKTGFWATKTFDWYYDANDDSNEYGHDNGYVMSPGDLQKTHYYCQARKPISHNGVIYSIIKDYTGFMYFGDKGPKWIDDDITYVDMIKFDGKIYALGYTYYLNKNENYEFKLTLREIKGRISKELKTPATNPSNFKEGQFVIHDKKLYVGIGNGLFLVKRPTHRTINNTKVV